MSKQRHRFSQNEKKGGQIQFHLFAIPLNLRRHSVGKLTNDHGFIQNRGCISKQRHRFSRNEKKADKSNFDFSHSRSICDGIPSENKQIKQIKKTTTTHKPQNRGTKDHGFRKNRGCMSKQRPRFNQNKKKGGQFQ